MAKFEMKIWSASKPTPQTVDAVHSGPPPLDGFLETVNNGDGTWTITSEYTVRSFSGYDSPNDITKVEIIVGDTLTSLADSFSNLQNMTEFIWHGEFNVTSLYHTWLRNYSLVKLKLPDVIHIESADSAWYICKNLVDFPTTDIKVTGSMFDMFNGCEKLKNVCAKIDTTEATDKTRIFYNCPALQHPTAQEIADLESSGGAVYEYTAGPCNITSDGKYVSNTTVNKYEAGKPTAEGVFGDMYVNSDGKWIYNGTDWEKYDLNRPEVESDFTASDPTLDEVKTAFKLLPNFSDSFWETSHDFYVYKDANKDKMILVKYRGETGNTEASPGKFFFEKLALIQ